MRMGYVHVRVTDLEESRSHYGETLGMKLVHEEPGKLYYKGWDEFDHHSVVLEEGGVGVVKFGYKVERETDLEELEQRARQFGCLTERPRPVRARRQYGAGPRRHRRRAGGHRDRGQPHRGLAVETRRLGRGQRFRGPARARRPSVIRRAAWPGWPTS